MAGDKEENKLNEKNSSERNLECINESCNGLVPHPGCIFT